MRHELGENEGKCRSRGDLLKCYNLIHISPELSTFFPEEIVLREDCLKAKEKNHLVS